MVNNFEKQRNELIDLINSENFISNFFPTYLDLQNKLLSINNDIELMQETRLSFSKWVEYGEIIDVEFEDIKQIEHKDTL